MGNIKKFGEREELAAVLADAGWEVEQSVDGLRDLAESWVMHALDAGESLGRDERRQLMAPAILRIENAINAAIDSALDVHAYDTEHETGDR